MTLQELIADIDTGLAGAANPAFNNPGAISDLFEVWIFCLVLRAAREEGFTVDFVDVGGNAVTTFVFRTSPGWVHGAHPYCHAVLSHPDAPGMELHHGVRVGGQSQTSHECDVALLTDTAAVASRASGTDPTYAGLKLAVECKFYASSLPLRLLREFMGLSLELGRRPTWVATNSTHASLHAILRRHNLRWEDELEPNVSSADRFRHEVRTLLDHVQR